MAKIKHSNEHFNGQVGAASFANGEAETDVATLVAYFKRHPERYTVDEDTPQTESNPSAGEAPGSGGDKTQGREQTRQGGDQTPTSGDGAKTPADSDGTTEPGAEDENPGADEQDGTPPAEDENPSVDEVGDQYADMTREQLRDAARARNLSTSGSRTELQERLRAADADNQ